MAILFYISALALSSCTKTHADTDNHATDVARILCRSHDVGGPHLEDWARARVLMYVTIPRGIHLQSKPRPLLPTL